MNVSLLLLVLSGLSAFVDAASVSSSRHHRHRRSISHQIPYDPSPDSLLPIRISVVRGVTDGLDASQVRTLDSVVQRAVERLESLINVRRVVGNLKLARPGGCKQFFTYGANKDKCASAMDGYRGDFCSDDFLIPNEHQVGFVVVVVLDVNLLRC